LAVFWLSSNADQALLIGTILQGVFLVAAVALTYYTARLILSRWAAVLATLLWLQLTYRVYLGGLEFSLHALLLVAVIYVYLRWFRGEWPQQRRFYLLLGTVAALAFLARLDTLLLSGILAAWLGWRVWRSGHLPTLYTHLLAFIAPVLLVVVGYMLINLAYFEHAIPVSSAVKRAWSAYLLAHDPLYQSHGWLVAKLFHVARPLRQFRAEWYVRGAALGTFGVALLWFLHLFGRRYRPWHKWFIGTLHPWGLFALYSGFSYLALTLVYHAGLSFSSWYFVIQPWVGSLAVGALVMGVAQWSDGRGVHASRRGQLASTLIILLSGLVLFGTIRGVFQWQQRAQATNSASPLLDAALWARAHLPAGAVIGAWNAGTIGYLSERRVINLDGVVNSWHFFETEQVDLCRYWDKTGITHLLDVFEGNQALSVVPMYSRYARCAERLDLIWSTDRYRATWQVKAYRVLRDQASDSP
jgi:hypothetical protein